MKCFHIIIIGLICIALAGLFSPAAALEAVLEPMPVDLKAPAEGATYEDEAFFSEADSIIASLSNRTIPTGGERMKVYSAYISLRDLSISPENYETARAVLAVVYYTAKASEALENYYSEKDSVTSLTTGSEFYDLADVYYMTVSNWWALIADRYPKVTLYKLPERDDILSEEAEGVGGIVLEGLKYPIPMAHVDPNPDELIFNDEKIKKTIQRWIEDNIDDLPNETDLQNPQLGKYQSLGNYFLTSDGLKFAKSTYRDLSTMNIHPEFYDSASYIDAFLYFISQAYEYYDQYLEERQSFMMISDGQEPYEMSQKYYEQAGVALSRFIKDVPEINQTTKLPVFPRFDEVSRGRMTLQEEDNSWGGTSWSGGHSGLY